MITASELREKFRAKFGSEARVYRAPGRVNLIGEYTDFNDGFVMPAAIGRTCWIAAAARTDRKLVVHSEEFSETFEWDFADGEPARTGGWSDYPVGVAVVFARNGVKLRGANLFIHGDVPIGAGLSSSAAIEVATGYALLDINGTPTDGLELARVAQRAENEFVGARCGIMDQFASVFGRAGKAIVLDCRSLGYELAPIPSSVHLMICNTMVKHANSSGEYNVRRAQCEEAVARLSAFYTGISALRDVTPEQLEKHRDALPDVVYRRAAHVVAENERVLAAVRALGAGDLAAFGQRMAESHESLRTLFEVSSPELDLMVELANRQEGVLGARMTGGGFGGSTINVVEAGREDRFRENMAREYEQVTGRQPDIQICDPAEGARRVE
ncbi:MAG: galactokinase [Candidatus Acidiferrales bacterium]